MSTLKDSSISAATVGGAPAQTMLPNTCGEETDLPGVPRVGCVAVVSYKPHTLHGFSACVVGMADGIAILGPDLTQRRYGRHCLLTRLLWRPATPLEGGSAAPPQNGTSILPHTKGSCASIVAITACLVAGEDGNEAHGAQETDEDDMIAIVVAWSDATLQHHVTVLKAQLRYILAPSSAGNAGNSGGHGQAELVQVVAHDALPLRPTQSVLRLFYHHAMAAFKDKSVPHHVVMCSVYSPLSRTTLPVGHLGQPDTGANSSSAPANTVMKQSHLTVGSSAAAPELGGTSAASRRRGELLFLALSPRYVRGASEATGADPPSLSNVSPKCSIELSAKPCTAKDVAPWLWQFQPHGVICAFAVQSTTTSVIAAAGTTDGRVYLLGQTSQRMVLRVSGPVADVVFVHTKRTNSRSRTRNVVVDGLLDDTMEEDTLRNGSFLSQTDEFALHEGLDFDALVILDSSGHLLVMRAVNSGAAITESVADIPQVITLVNGQQPTPAAVNPSITNLEDAPINSKNFQDLSTLRHLFSRRRPPLPQMHPQQQQQRKTGRSHSSPVIPPLASSSLSTSPVNQSFTNGATGAEETSIAGHILSRGLLCVTCVYNAKGSAELLVSTMGQVVVSVPFSPTDGCFRIAGFTITPAPMFYVGFVEFFADGSPTLVMAGLKNVLVASCPQSTVRDRAQLLLRLLDMKEREQQNAKTSGVDG
ncbi:hypothetical protein, conserved [Leishmania tarentolae]|uniref:Uncharacterized protein n=1 Tax=Leishmania tarentolae TaxID=5689 RepID=A0A640KZL4_LEITA|nr:hypothetical protein, conserved [Leishmania tarentolae]